ncbi:MAG: hypothetical protein B6I19_08430 [Bacteroidetes bacterium 4572_114]|nr:MAG: hypothetical protein B6I19_08430 [Bacteroidetes bacterium 4572_114]
MEDWFQVSLLRFASAGRQVSGFRLRLASFNRHPASDTRRFAGFKFQVSLADTDYRLLFIDPTPIVSQVSGFVS